MDIDILGNCVSCGKRTESTGGCNCNLDKLNSFDVWFSGEWGLPPKEDADLFTYADLKEAFVAGQNVNDHRLPPRSPFL